MKGAVKTLFFLSMFITQGAHAAIFMCTDASGRTYTSDRLIPECADRAVREYRGNGMIKKEIAAPLTAEQKREKLLQEEKKKIELVTAEEQRKSDRALSARYRTEEEIVAARKREAAVIGEQITYQKKALSLADKERIETYAAVEAQKKRGVVPAGLQYKSDRAQQSAHEMQKRVSESEAELVKVHAKYDVILQRYREITKVASAKQ
jgi:hypothetical protein